MRKVLTILRLISNRDSLLRFYLLQRVGRWLVPKYRFNWPQLAWWDDHEFNLYLHRFNEMQSNNADRHWMLSQLLGLVADLPGDTAECGVFKGASSYLICKANKKSKYRRRHHMFDSFLGLSRPSTEDGSFWSEGDLSCSLEEVQHNLNEFEGDDIHFYPGWIPTTFNADEGRRFSFVHIDVDLYKPTLDSLAYFYPRMQPGGIILFDDYGFTSCPGATAACDEFLREMPETMVSLPCGGGFIICTHKDCI